MRPEHLELLAAPGDDGAGLTATVEVIEHLGHEQHVVCRLTDGQLVTVRQPSHQAAPAALSPVTLRARAEHLHRFDPTTGERAA